MYQIDKDQNRISALTPCKFSDLGFRERDHLQEWLAHNPTSLGEDLLIIQKEFDGFDDTRERLDLLALDKDGNVMVIENKLDDSGRDVVWQAIKYASYCSSLSKRQVIEIYQKYLDKYHDGQDAEESLCAFLEQDDLDEVILNKGNGQRLVFVAANFRKEVTSTALWLLSHNITVQCFKVTPYMWGEQVFLDIKQIIPVPEVKELMIGMSAKAAEEKHIEEEQKTRFTIRTAFWTQALDALKESPCNLFDNINPSNSNWLSAGSGMRHVPYILIFGTKEIRVELGISRADKRENKWIFDELHKRKELIEDSFGNALIWDRLDNNKQSSIRYRKSIDGYNEDNWPEIIEWMLDHMKRLEKALKPHLVEVNEVVKHQSFSSQEEGELDA
jgi:hypothetical protein